MTKKNAPYIIVISILIIGFLVVAIAFIRDKKAKEKTQITARIYYKTASNSIEYEEHPIQIQENKEMADAVLEKFQNSPKNPNLFKNMPDGLKIVESPKLIIDPERTDLIFAINFSREYYNMTPVEEMLFRASLVWTMTDLDFINNVEIKVENENINNSTGMPINLQNRINIDIHPLIKPYKTESREIVLYFADETGSKLLNEQRLIEVNPDLPIEKFIVDQIIRGPGQKGHFPTVSADVKILRVENQEGTCFVDLSADFLSKGPSMPVTDEVAIYSIVNSLMEVTRVRKVQFLIEETRGNIDLSRPFERNNDIISEKT